MNLKADLKKQIKGNCYPLIFARVKTIRIKKIRKKRFSEYYLIKNIDYEQFYKVIIKL
jgi:hypothetical protein